MLIEYFRDMQLVIVYRMQLSMFFLYVIDLLLRSMFREMRAIWIQYVLDECGGGSWRDLRAYQGCFNFRALFFESRSVCTYDTFATIEIPKIMISFKVVCLSMSERALYKSWIQDLWSWICMMIESFRMNKSLYVIMVSGSTPSNASSMAERMSRPMIISMTNFDISYYWCEITMLWVWILVNVIAILSNNDEIVAVIIHHISDGAWTGRYGSSIGDNFEEANTKCYQMQPNASCLSSIWISYQ